MFLLKKNQYWMHPKDPSVAPHYNEWIGIAFFQENETALKNQKIKKKFSQYESKTIELHINGIACLFLDKYQKSASSIFVFSTQKKFKKIKIKFKNEFQILKFQISN
ncbi:hypothetical protein BpHYR1_011409 [Brachionus plicatilis]|uniref:Uncharacterized protein n=1 Tax=Brachionus plicatilis TaxID=10195 RepID=A0A3M7R3H5_BRAPC|nr:hypothetical protein BpHYR1_011409 [Brachionus plicatilis]